MKLRKIIALLLISILLVTLCACGEEQESFTNNQQFSNDAGTSIDVLREEIGQTTALFGMTYIGYFDSTTAKETGIDFNQWFSAASSPVAAYYPFISEIDEDHTIGTEGHLYCVIAKDYESSITVNTIDNNEVLYSAKNGNPVLIFCNRDGNAEKSDTTVTITTSDGTVCQWEPTLDQMGEPKLLIDNQRDILSYPFSGDYVSDFDFASYLAEGWMGPTAVGLASVDNGNFWWFNTNDASYCLSFYLEKETDYGGEVVIECFYYDNSTIEAQWDGHWSIETEMEQPSRLYLDLSLTEGRDMEHYKDVATISESYQIMTPLSGNSLLMVTDNINATKLPMFSDGDQAIELALVG